MQAFNDVSHRLKLLSEIHFWKTHEKEHSLLIRELVPSLEPEYASLLTEWEAVFHRMEHAAQKQMQAAIRFPGEHADVLEPQAEMLARASAAQSAEWCRQLFHMTEQSAALRSRPTAKEMVSHLIKESDYFLHVLRAFTAIGPAADTEDKSPLFQPVSPFRSDIVPGDLTKTSEGTWSNPVPGKPVPPGGHKLPPLPYAYNALEPYIDEETMRLHHDKHHKSYVDGLNKAETMMAKARESGDFELIKHWEREAAFHGAGHYLHTIFWNIMSPKGGGKATGAIAQQIDRDFGNFRSFRSHFSAAADKVEGGGWAILVWSPRSHRLEILQAEKHQNLSQWDVVPLLVLDVWEHAYYLKYNNNRRDYIEAWWNVVNWDHVNVRFAAARALKWTPF